jgi:5'-nucleotidase
MHILITNDDGIYAEGIQSLVMRLKEIARITVAAPNREKSATGHAITMHSPITVKKINRFGTEIQAFSINGTPADCIKLSLDVLLENDKPDLVVAGINNGPNLGTDVIYSGTVSGAIEASIMGLPAIAVSMAHHQIVQFDDAARYTRDLIPDVLNNSQELPIIYNINFPVCDRSFIKGTRITRLGIRRYVNNFIHRTDPRGNSYYWMAGELMDIPQEVDSDMVAVREQYISITPLHYDLTHYPAIPAMEAWEKKFR